MRTLLRPYVLGVLMLMVCRSRATVDAGVAHLRLLPAPPCEASSLPALIAERQYFSRNEGRVVLVYVGATWCEPCRQFQDAAEKGLLDAHFGDVDLLVFDADVDGERLTAAGYSSRLIPLLVVPDADGRATDRRMEGSVKGDAIGDLVPRLKTLLQR